jgi:hypothetical protein
MKPSELLTHTGRVIGYRPKLAKLFGGVTVEIFFEQIFYWQDKADPEFGVYKTQEDLEEETGLSRREQETARKKLRNLGILIETHKRLEHKIYYKIDTAALDRFLQQSFANAQNVQSRMAESDIRDSTKTPFVIQEITNTRLHSLDISPLNPPKGETDRKRSPSGEKLQAENADLPNWVDRETWQAYCQMRKAKGKAIKTRATLDKCLHDLERHSGSDSAKAKAILLRSIGNTWTGIFALNEDKQADRRKPKPENFSEKVYKDHIPPYWQDILDGKEPDE